MRQQFHRAIAGTIFFILCLVVCLLLFLHFVLFSISVRTYSMEPDTRPGQLLFVSPLFSMEPRLTFLELKRGDMILAQPRIGKRPPLPGRILAGIAAFFTAQKATLFAPDSPNTETPILARLLGVPGDTIYMENYVLHIRPAGAEHFLTEFELVEQDYNIQVTALPKNWDNTLAVAGAFPPVTLEADRYFLLCDNRTCSVDSRIFGPMGEAHFKGKAVLRYFPFDAFTFF
ncbi:MAG: signal peptidase I [Spirochaetaceae bacterium]|jgi:signal peptidase I|nr:signal peptidase I [Spirochaetaceae bacterium]